MMRLLTIGIPTFNRRDLVVSLVTKIMDNGLLNKVNVIVIDDASTDGTYDALSAKFSEPCNKNDGSFILIRHECNKGMAAGFIRIFDECRTDYLIMFADDDEVYPLGVEKLLAEITSLPADFICTAWLSSGKNPKVFRGKVVTSRIPVPELRAAANHAPGLVYRVSAVKPWLQYLNACASAGDYAALIFPQVIITFLIAMAGGVMRYSSAAPGGFRVHGATASGLRDVKGNHWGSVPGRWREQVSFSDFLKKVQTGLLSSGPGIVLDEQDVVKRLGQMHLYESFSRLRSGVIFEQPEIKDYFDAGAVAMVAKNPLRSIKLLFSYIIYKLKKNKE